MDLRETFAAINRLEAAKIIDRWAVGGATGATFFLEPLVTEDVDIFVKHGLASKWQNFERQFLGDSE